MTDAATPPVDAPDVAPEAARGERAGLFLAVLILLCAAVAAGTIHVATARDVLDTSDEAGYAEQADALRAGKGLSIGFVQFHHTEGSPDVEHPEDLYPPGAGALHALAYHALGKSEFAATVPSTLLQCLALPLLAFFLARRLGARAPFAFACGAAALFDMVLREAAFQGLSDLPFSTCMLGAALLAFRSSRGSAALAGLLLAAGYWFKPTALLFTPGTAALRVFGADRPFSKAVVDVVVMAVVFVAGAAPWLMRNHQTFGDPTYSSNKHITAIANKPGFDYDDNYRAYWTDPDFVIPSMSESVERFGAHAVVTRILVHVYEVFVSKGHVIFGFVFWAAALLLVQRRRPRAVLLHLLIFVLALSAVFAVEVRYLLPCIPFALALTWAGLDRLVAALRLDALLERSPLRRLGAAAPAAGAALVLAAIWAGPGVVTFARDLAFGLPGGARGDVCIRDAAVWVGENLPEDARVMTHQPARTRYYSGRLSVMTPFDVPERIQRIVEHYGIDTILMNDEGILEKSSREYLTPYFERYGEAWEHIEPEGATFDVYRRR